MYFGKDFWFCVTYSNPHSVKRANELKSFQQMVLSDHQTNTSQGIMINWNFAFLESILHRVLRVSLILYMKNGTVWRGLRFSNFDASSRPFQVSVGNMTTKTKVYL